MTDRPIITPPTSPMAPSTTTTDTIRRGGLRRLRAGLPLDVGTDPEPQRHSPRSLSHFAGDVDRALEAATVKKQTALLVRANHRPIPTGTEHRGIGRWQIHGEVVERLYALHTDLVAIALSDHQILVFVPDLRRRDEGEQLLAKIMEALSTDVIVDGLPHVLEPRVGGALFDSENATAERLLDAAEIALAETDTTHHHVLFHAHQRVRSDHHVELTDALREAIVEHTLTVALQPAIDLQTGAIVAIEAFARWELPDRGPIPTTELIRAAASVGVLNRVGEQILQKSLFHVSDWVDEGLLGDVTLWLNMTATDMLDHHLVRTILDGTQLNERVKVGVELSPSSSPDAQAVISTLRALGARNARAAIGDLGVGFASFADANHLPFDSVKLDRSLMTRIATDDNAAAVVRHLVGIATALGLEPTAQGIEQPEQLALVREMGCPIAQGYVFTKPLAPADFEEFVRQWDPASVAGPSLT